MKKPATLATIAAVATLSVAASVPAHAAHEDIIVPLAVAGAIIYMSDNNRHDGHDRYRDHRHDNYKSKANARRHYGYHRRAEVRHSRWHARNDHRRGYPYYRDHEKYHRAQQYSYRDRHRDWRH